MFRAKAADMFIRVSRGKTIMRAMLTFMDQPLLYPNGNLVFYPELYLTL